VLGDEAIYREWGYVALSRGREHNSFYIVVGEETKAHDLEQVTIDAGDPISRVQRALERSGAKEMALDSAVARHVGVELRELSDDEVRRERDELAAAISHGPPDPTDELERLRQQWAPIEHALAGARRHLDDARARLSDRALRRSERGALEDAAVEAQSRVRQLEARLQDLTPQVREVGGRHREWREWAKEAAPELRRYLAVEAELAERGREAARWAQSLEAGEVIDLVGRRPDGLASRSRWREALEAASSHMLRWASRPGNAGQVQVQELEAARQRQARRVERALAEAARHRELDCGMDRDIGPSL
jgi:chromosome segregation ATPase